MTSAAVAVGTAAGRVATTSVAGTGSQLFSVVISPGTEITSPTNGAPVASFTSACTELTCSFDAAASSDPDDDDLTYAWAFGDGSTGGGVTASRTYATAGTRTVT